MGAKKVTHLIRNCSWKFKCSKDWDSLDRIKHLNFELVRYCSDCGENVHLVNSEGELLTMIEQNKCVSIPFDLTDIRRMLDKSLLGSLKINL